MSLALFETYLIFIHWMSYMLSGNPNWGKGWRNGRTIKQTKS